MRYIYRKREAGSREAALVRMPGEQREGQVGDSLQSQSIS